VEPEVARKGVGAALVREIERIAEESGLQKLELLASVNVESFYTFLGYQADRRTGLVLSTGVAMAAVKMAKTLR
jgi:putative acetyltransferase